MWVKRYLSLFFNFKYFGILTWFTIPLLIYFFATLKKRRRWEKALVFVLILSVFSLELKGGYWPRYLLTIYPFILTLIFLFGWEFIKEKNHYVQIGILIICVIGIFFNFYYSRDLFSFYWKYKVTVEENFFPHNLLRFIDDSLELDSKSTILVCSNRNIFHYYTNKKGIDYRSPQLEIFNNHSKKEAALDVLKNQLNIKYIFFHWDSKPSSILMNIISDDCESLYKDKNGYTLYKIREKELNKEELEKLFVNDSLLKNGSFENWSHGTSKKPDFFEGGDNISDDMVSKEEKEVWVGKYSAKIIGDNFNFTQDLSNFEAYRGKSLTCFAWIKTTVPDKYRIQIYDGINSSFSILHSGKGNWELLQANYTVNPSAKFVQVRVVQAEQTGNVNDVVYVDGALLVEGDWNTFYLYNLSLHKE